MKGDISGEYHDSRKNCSGARAQQGRVLTDADFNVALDIVDDSIERLVRTLLCAAGSPDEGFRITGATPATLSWGAGETQATMDLTIAPGSFLLGGRSHILRGPGTYLDQDDWLSLPIDPDSDAIADAPVADRADLVWLEAVERPFRAVEDREIQERALGSADTTTRLRPQLRVRVMTDTSEDCDNAAAALRAMLGAGPTTIHEDGSEIISAARLGVSFVADEPTLDPCAPRTAAGYLGAENQTLKVMLTAPDRFVWALDHGEPLYRVQVDAANGRILFLTEPRDPVLWPVPGQVIELLPWDVYLPNGEKTAAPSGFRARITGDYDPTTRAIDYDGSLPPEWQAWLDNLPDTLEGRDDPDPRFFYARLWYQPTAGTGTDEPVGTEVALPGFGVALSFDGEGLVGDYWTVSLRTDAPQLIVPWALKIESGGTPVAPPAGPRRFFAPLAILRWRSVAGELEAEIHDCRNRFRRLCRIKGCCTYQVGDGHQSFGDFNDLQDAIDALPDEGGEICLLPGVHDGPVDLTRRRGITISGCGPRSVLRVAATGPEGGPPRPAIDITVAEGITLREFRIECVSSPAVEAMAMGVTREAATRGIRLYRLQAVVQTGSAILLARVDNAEIASCDVRHIVTDPGSGQRVPDGAPLVFIAGRDIAVRDSRIVVDHEPRQLRRDATTRHSGGLQVGGLSRGVVVERNRIVGGAGNGITLGSVRPVAETPPQILSRPYFVGWVALDDDGCPKLEPPGTGSPPGPDPTDPDGGGPPPLQSDGPIDDLEIRRNRIEEHGASGISVAHWFVARVDDELDRLDDIEVRTAAIRDNRIYGCMRIDLRGIADIEAAFASAFGGIVLAAASDLDVADNQVRGCGRQGRSPICGVYVRDAERLRVTDNRLTENGRTATLREPLLVGNIGGIVVGNVAGGVAGTPGGTADALLNAPAAFVSGNRVVSPEGRALELTGSGQMVIHGNTLTAHGNNALALLRLLFQGVLPEGSSTGNALVDSNALVGQLRAAFEQIGGSAVLVINSGTNPNMNQLAAGYRTAVPAAEGGPASDDPGNRSIPYDDTAYVRAGIDLGRRVRTPQGRVAFDDNTVVFDALSNAQTFSICAVALVSFDDVAMHDNHVSVDVGADLVPINTLALGLFSCRVQGNRFRETLSRSSASNDLFGDKLSLVSFGLLNASEMNQGTHCFFTFGFKKPRIVFTEEEQRPVLDTNRHTIFEDACESYFSISSAFGTD